MSGKIVSMQVCCIVALSLFLAGNGMGSTNAINLLPSHLVHDAAADAAASPPAGTVAPDPQIPWPWERTIIGILGLTPLFVSLLLIVRVSVPASASITSAQLLDKAGTAARRDALYGIARTMGDSLPPLSVMNPALDRTVPRQNRRSGAETLPAVPGTYSYSPSRPPVCFFIERRKGYSSTSRLAV